MSDDDKELANKEAKNAIAKMMAEILPDLTTSLKEKMHEKTLEAFSWQVRTVVDAEVKGFIESAVVPEVRAYLAEHKAELLAEILGAIQALSQHAMKAIVDQGLKRLSGYEGEQMVEKFMRLFSGR